MKQAWVNGHFTDRVSPFDAGFQLGVGVFETMGVFDSELPLWPDHLSRLEKGAATLGIAFEVPKNLRRGAVALLEEYPGDDVLRLLLTAGEGEHATWCMTTRPRGQSSAHLRLHPSSYGRHRTDPVAAIKSSSYAFHYLARREAMAAGCDDALLMGDGDRVLETTTGNVFFTTDGVLCTPRLDGAFLPGVGRGVLIRQLRAAGVVVEESDYTLTDLRDAVAIFTTNAVFGPRPAALSRGVAAPLTVEVSAAWRRAVETVD